MSIKILVIEDERELLDTTTSGLGKHGFKVLGLQNPEQTLAVLSEFQPDIVLMDNMMPGITGDQLVRKLRESREFSKIPIIMISGRIHESEKVDSFEYGVDDYLTKPFSMKELIARINALYRRQERKKDLKGLAIDVAAHRVTYDGKEVSLTLTEFNLLRELLANLDRVLSRDLLRRNALNNPHAADRTIDVHMTSLRKKLSGVGRRIHTVRGVGYIMKS